MNVTESGQSSVSEKGLPVDGKEALTWAHWDPLQLDHQSEELEVLHEYQSSWVFD